CMQGPEFPWTF
nr:immunoglobulin light chain junction region [Macaca mulatta]MOX56727.1 immunoglobulin light chain junction region [Macaca mulatta]